MVDTTIATIGDIIHFSIEISGAGENPVTIGNFENNDVMEIRNRSISANKLVEMELVFWDTGRYSIPALDVRFLNADSSEKVTLQSDPQNIIILSAIDPTAVGIMKPIKDPLPVSKPLPLKMIVMITLIILPLVIMLWLRWKYKTVHLINKPSKIFKQPDVLALEKLVVLHEELNQNLNIKEFYVDLSYILREYVEYSIYVKTLEMTTENIRLAKKELPFSGDELTNWLALLERADLTKYARMIPKRDICENDIFVAESFVRATIPYWKQSIPSKT